MKRYLVILALVLGTLAFLFAAGKALSEDLTFSRAYADYVYNMDLYNKAHSDYQVARANYLQYGTLISKQNAQDATLKMLQARDEVIKTYLTALRARLSEAAGVSTDKKNELFALIDTEVSWIINHEQSLPSAGSLDDLVKDSNEVKDHYGPVELLIYRVLTTIAVGKTTALRDREQNVLGPLNTKITEIKANGDKDTTVAERGVLDIQAKLARSQAKEDEAFGIVQDMKATASNKNSIYDDALDSVGQALQYIKESGSLLMQIITNIKTKD